MAARGPLLLGTEFDALRDEPPRRDPGQNSFSGLAGSREVDKQLLVSRDGEATEHVEVQLHPSVRPRRLLTRNTQLVERHRSCVDDRTGYGVAARATDVEANAEAAVAGRLDVGFERDRIYHQSGGSTDVADPIGTATGRTAC
jgi:hypothetical protein